MGDMCGSKAASYSSRLFNRCGKPACHVMCIKARLIIDQPGFNAFRRTYFFKP
jgi:hypothetical protein